MINRMENIIFELKTKKLKLPEVILSRITPMESPSVSLPLLNPGKRMK